MGPSRALSDITSGQEVRQIFKVRTDRKPDVFLPRRRTFNTSKKSKKNTIFFSRFICVYLFGVRTFETKFVFKNISPAGPVRQIWVSGSVRSGNSFPLICPVLD